MCFSNYHRGSLDVSGKSESNEKSAKKTINDERYNENDSAIVFTLNQIIPVQITCNYISECKI